MTKIYHISSSARSGNSHSRCLSSELAEKLAKKHNGTITRRDVTSLPVLDDALLQAMMSPADQRSDVQKELLAISDAMIAELQQADIVVIGTPLYNFGAPAALKAWADLVARAGITFKYTETGPVGLLDGEKQVYVVATSGGVTLGDAPDFLTPWLKTFLGFIGLGKVDFVNADRLVFAEAASLAAAAEKVNQIAA